MFFVSKPNNILGGTGGMSVVVFGGGGFTDGDGGLGLGGFGLGLFGDGDFGEKTLGDFGENTLGDFVEKLGEPDITLGLFGDLGLFTDWDF